MHSRRLLRQRRVRSSSARSAGRFGYRALLGEQLESRLLLAGDVSFHNARLPSDTDGNGWSNGIDVAILVNELNYGRGGKLSSGVAAFGEGETTTKYFVDVNNDGYLTPLDVLNAVNRINEGEGQGDVMKYVLKTYNAAGTEEITTINVGGTFQLRVFVDDLRTLGPFPPDHPTMPGQPQEGVFSAYLDVLYDADLASIPAGARIMHNIDTYGEGPSGDISQSGVIDHAGSFRGSARPPGPDPVLLWTLQFQAGSPGVLTFVGEPTTDPNDPGDEGQSPAFDTGLYGENRPVCPSASPTGCFGSMGFDNVSITIVQDIVAVDDQVTVNEDIQNHVIDVMANDVLATGTAKLLESFTAAANGTVTRDDRGTPDNRADDRLFYTPAPNFNGVDTFTYTISNGEGSTSTATVTVTVTAVNDAPQNTVPGPQTIAEDTELVFSGPRLISVADVDADAGGGLQVTLTVNNGRLVPSSSSAAVTGANTGTVTITGLVADVNAALSGLRYIPNQDFFGSDTLTVLTDDQGNTGSGGPLSATSTVNITITAVDDPPVNVLPPSPQTTDEDVPLVLSSATGNALSIVDVDAGASETAQVTLSLPAASTGHLTLASTTGLTFTQGDGTADTTMTFTGTLSAINAALAAGLTYTPASLFLGSDSLTISTTSQGQTDTDVLGIEVVPTVRPRAINDTVTIDEDSGTSVIDVLANDRPNQGAQATLLNFTQPANGVVTRNDNGTPQNLADDTLSYRPNANFFGTDSFTYTINDTSGEGADSTATVVVTVLAVNDAPELTLPATQTVAEDTQLAFAAGAVSVADVDAGTNPVAVTLNVSNGTLAVATTSGLTVEGAGTASVRLVGPLTALNTALNGLTYSPTANFNGTDVLAITVDDQGHTGKPGPLTATGSVTINVTAVNDPPVNTVPPDQSPFITNFDNVLSAANGNAIQVSDVDAGTANIRVTISVTGGTLSVGDSTSVTVSGNGTGSLTLTGPQAQINALLAAGLTYRNSAEGSFSVTVTTNDLGNTGAGGPQTDTDSFGIEVVSFVPSVVGGRVFLFNDANRNGQMDSNEIGPGLAGVRIRLTGTDFRDQAVQLETLTDRNGAYRFDNLRPGTYQLQEDQPFGVRDGSEWFEAPTTAVANDTGRIEIGIRGGVSSLNNHFTERGLEAQYITAAHLLASSADPQLGSGLVFAVGGSSWHVLNGGAWAGYQDAHFSLAANGQSGVLTVRESSTGNYMQTTVLLNSGRLVPSQDGKVITIIGRPSDFTWESVAGEGEGGSLLAAADYQRGVDAVFGAMDEQFA